METKKFAPLVEENFKLFTISQKAKLENGIISLTYEDFDFVLQQAYKALKLELQTKPQS